MRPFEKVIEILLDNTSRCPHCKNELEDLWEYNVGLGEESIVECPHCEKDFFLSADVKYTTREVEEEQEA